MSPNLEYPEIVLTRLRYRFCPLCATPLALKNIDDDGIARAACPSCGWVHFPANALGVNLIIYFQGGIVAILPHDEPDDAPAALPGGHIEYAESPEQAAVREAREETGLDVEVIRCLGWYFDRNTSYPGPMLSFVFETRATGGAVKASQEGAAKVFPLDQFPAISPNRKGSRRAMQMLISRNENDSQMGGTP